MKRKVPLLIDGNFVFSGAEMFEHVFCHYILESSSNSTNSSTPSTIPSLVPSGSENVETLAVFQHLFNSLSRGLDEFEDVKKRSEKSEKMKKKSSNNNNKKFPTTPIPSSSSIIKNDLDMQMEIVLSGLRSTLIHLSQFLSSSSLANISSDPSLVPFLLFFVNY